MDFLSVFYSMYGPILYGFPHIARYWSGGITKFICPTCIHCPRSGWPRQYFAKMFNTGKLEWWGCRVLKKVWWCGKPCWYSTGTWQMDIWTEFLYQCRTSALLCSCSCFVLLSLCHSETNLQTELLRQLHWLPIAERVTSFVFSSTTQQLNKRRLTLLTYFSQPPPLHHAPRCEPQVVETMSCHGQIEDSQIEHSPLLHHGRGTNCWLILKMTHLSSAVHRGLFQRAYSSE